MNSDSVYMMLMLFILLAYVGVYAYFYYIKGQIKAKEKMLLVYQENLMKRSKELHERDMLMAFKETEISDDLDALSNAFAAFVANPVVSKYSKNFGKLKEKQNEQ